MKFTLETKAEQFAKLPSVKWLFLYISLQVNIFNCSGFGFTYNCVSFSRVRKSERIERKFKTQNPNPKYEGFFPGVVKVQGHGVFQIG